MGKRVKACKRCSAYKMRYYSGMDNSTIPSLRISDLPEQYREESPERGEYSGRRYFHTIERLQRDIGMYAADMSQDHLAAIKQAFAGLKTSEIADDLDIKPATVRRILKTPAAKRITALLHELQLTMDGPPKGQRIDLLWRIAQRNELTDPRVAISATGELNKMEYNEQMLESGKAGPQSVEIVINNQTLPRGALD